MGYFVAQELQSLGLSCSFHELMGEDHFSLTEQMESDDCALNKVQCTVVCSE